MTLATSTLEASVGAAAALFGDAVTLAIADASAIQKSVRGLQDGNDYGRYFAGQDPLVPFAPSAGSLDELIAQGVALRSAAAAAVTAMIAAASGDAGAFADAVQLVVTRLRQGCADPGDAIRLLSALAAFRVTLNPGTDAIGVQISTIAENAAVLMRRASAIALAEAAADYVPSSQQDAEAVRDQVADVLDGVALEAADRFEDQSSAGLDALRIAVVNDLTQRGASLAPVALRRMPKPLPAPVAAYALYQDSGRADELVARNNPPHPGFLPVVIEASVA